MDIEIPGYTLLRTLGKGGMATVYLARQNMLERAVALKIMSRSLAEDPAFGARFMREAKIVSQLVHPNIVTVYEVGQQKDCFFLSMEYIDGHDLRSVRKTLDLEGKIRVIEDIARALHYAGEKGYVHRDIKPENIMFRQADGSAVLTDFGIAKAVESDLTMTQTGTAIGTPHYMSPEQAKGKDVDQRSDLYSLGVVFYLLLVGRVPFDADTAIAIGIKHLTEPVPQLPRQYEELQYVIDGLLAKSPKDRYQSGLHLLNDLRRVDFDRINQELHEVDPQPTVAANVPTEIAEALVTSETVSSENETVARDDSKRFTLEFEVAEPLVEKPPRSILPTFFATLFVLFSIGVFVYFARPPALEKYIASFEATAGDAYQSASAYIQDGAEVVAEAFNGLKSEYQDSELLVNETEGNTEVDRSATDELAETKNERDANVDALSDSSAGTENVTEDNSEKTLAANDQLLSEVQALAEDVKPEPSIPEVIIPTLEALQLELENVRQQNSGAADLSPEVAALKNILEHYPDDQATLDELSSLKQSQQLLLIEAAKKGDRERVARGLDEYQSLFSSRLDVSAFGQFKAELNDQLKIVDLHKLADQQIKNRRLSTPKNDNAIESLNAILALDSNNSSALRKLKTISLEFYEQSSSAYKKQKFAQAEQLVKKALLADSSSEQARQLQRDVKDAIKRRTRLDETLRDAKKYADLGYLYTPEGANAYDAYKRALQLDPESSSALEGLNGLMDKLSVQIWALVGEAKFDQAKSKLSRPLILMPNNKRILAMQAAVNDVAEER